MPGGRTAWGMRENSKPLGGLHLRMREGQQRGAWKVSSPLVRVSMCVRVHVCFLCHRFPH